MAELHDLTALEQGRAIANGETSSIELTIHYLDRSELLNADLGAFARLLPERALRAAAAADARVAARTVPVGSVLHGVVCPVQDSEVVAGVPTGFGNASLNMVSDTDAHVVTALRDQGLVFTGKTATPELGLTCYTEPEGQPPARNPWNLQLTASGSAGGAAAAVAAGLAPVAQARDGNGSLRLPAGVCGLVGIKPSRGRVSTGPFSYWVGDSVAIGPLARTVRDAAALLDVMCSHPAVGDPFHARPARVSFLDAARQSPGRLRIGFFTAPVVGETEASATVRAAIEATAALLTELGHDVVEIAPPLTHEVVPLLETLWASLAASVAFPEQVEATFTPFTRYLRARAEDYTAAELAAAVNRIRVLARKAILATQEFDAVLSPTATDIAFPVGSMRNDEEPGAEFEAHKQWSSYAAIYNVTGQPAMTVPLNWTPEGLPIGLQFAGRPYEDALLITLSAQLEEARPWIHRRPNLW